MRNFWLCLIVVTGIQSGVTSAQTRVSSVYETASRDLAEADTYHRSGTHLLEQSDYEAAIVAFEMAIQLKPGVAQFHNDLGYVNFLATRYPQAIKAYLNAIKIQPNYPTAYMNLGMVYSQLKDYEKAVSCFTTVTVLDPTYAGAYYNLGITYYQTGQITKSAIALEQAIRLNPHYAQAMTALGSVYIDEGCIDEAIAILSEALTNDPGSQAARRYIGNAYFKDGQYEKAIEPAPDPNEWFHAKIVLHGIHVSVYVNNEKTPSLEVDRISRSTHGKVGLWVGNTSPGSFAYLRINP